MKGKAFNKRAVSCLVALALMLSCFVTSFAGSLVPYNGDVGNSTTSIKVTSNGGRVYYTIGSNPEKNTRSQYIGSPAQGTECVFRAVDTATRVFLYWQDMYSGRVYSYDRIVKFTAGSSVYLRCLFATVTEQEHFVSFVNYGGTILQSDSYAVGAAVEPPIDTKIPGFTFTGWSKSASEIANDAGDVVVYPQYNVNEESYTVTLTDESYASGAGTYSNFQTVNLKAEEKNGSGESFSYWQDGSGTIVSYDRNYSFRINYDVTLTPVFGEAVTPEPVIRISKINRDLADMKITFYAERSVPADYTVISHGMLMAVGTGVTDANMTLASAGSSITDTVRKVNGTSNELCGTFSLAKTKIGRTEQVNVRPYVIVKNADGEQFVAYGDIVRTTNGATN